MADSTKLTGIGAPIVASADTVAQHKIGQRAWDQSGNEYEYVKNAEASTAFAQYDLVILKHASAVRGEYVLSATADGGYPGPYGIAQYACAASSYAWIMRNGVTSAHFDKSALAGSNAGQGAGAGCSDGAAKYVAMARNASSAQVDYILGVFLATSDGDGDLAFYIGH